MNTEPTTLDLNLYMRDQQATVEHLARGRTRAIVIDWFGDPEGRETAEQEHPEWFFFPSDGMWRTAPEIDAFSVLLPHLEIWTEAVGENRFTSGSCKVCNGRTAILSPVDRWCLGPLADWMSEHFGCVENPLSLIKRLGNFRKSAYMPPDVHCMAERLADYVTPTVLLNIERYGWWEDPSNPTPV